MRDAPSSDQQDGRPRARGADARAERLRAALRANLGRRKAQARERASGEGAPGTGSDAPERD